MDQHALKQLHFYVCMMIELKNYALTDKTRAVFDLCKASLKQTVVKIPSATDVVNAYTEVEHPHKMTAKLCKTNYTDKFVDDVNGILTEILLADTPKQMVETFDRVAHLN